MPTTTARLGLSDPIGADNPSQIRLAATANAAILDNAAIYLQGTLTARALLTPATGTYYFATDVGPFGVVYRWNGTHWITQAEVAAGQDVLAPFPATFGQPVFTGARFFATAGVGLVAPAPVAGATWGVVAGSTTSGTNPITITYGSGGGGFFGTGLANPASSFLLGAPEASVTLGCLDGTNWVIVSGQADTGWVALSLTANWSTGAFGTATAAARRISDRGYLRGWLTNGTGGSVAYTGSVPAFATPAFTQQVNTVQGVSVSTGAVLSSIASIANGASFILDGMTYPTT